MAYQRLKRSLEVVEEHNKLQKKNPIQELHERYPTIEYVFEQKGLDHQPTFEVNATVEGRLYIGSGLSKQKAKFDLATQVLQELGYTNRTSPLFSRTSPLFSEIEDLAFLQQKETYLQRYQNLNYAIGTDYSPISYDFTADVMPGRDQDRPLYAPPRFRTPPQQNWITRQSYPHSPPHPPPQNHDISPKKHPYIMGPLLPPEVVAHGFSQLFTNRPEINIEKARSFPVMVLCEVFPDMQISWCEGIGRGDRQFKVEAEVQGRRFFGEGRSKKIAKLNLAKTILLCMYDIQDFKDAEASPKTSKPKSEEIQLEKKFPLTQLKELVGEDLSITVVQQEPTTEDEEKLFQASINIKGVEYQAVGKNKNLAKLRAAKKALDTIRPKKEGATDKNAPDPLIKKEVDVSRHPTMLFYELYRDVKFTESECKSGAGLTEYQMEAQVEEKLFKAKASSKKKAKLRLVLQAFEELKEIPVDSWTAVDVKEVLEDKQISNNPAHNHPIVLLLKLNPQTRFDVTEDYNGESNVKYKASARVGDRDFNGEGQNKKSAKTIAAREALHALYGIDPDDYVEENRTDYFTDSEPQCKISPELCTMIANYVQEKFFEVFQGETQCKVIAAFVLARYDHDDESNPVLEVVSIGTGTKCITGDQIDHKGQTLNDSHGEIIACRGFRQFLFDHLILACNNDSHTIFDRSQNKKFRLKSNFKVYLYVNTAPCGDGRVFTLQTPQPGAKNKTAGLLRTKIENGQGTIPVPENNIQTSDGLLEGERLRTMSCSDKILKWNALGVQGALLSYFIDPIYIEGVVISLHYNYAALYRALYKRAGKMEDCPSPYSLHKPRLGTPSHCEISRNTSKATSNSFNWYSGQKNVEAVNATTGKTVVLSPSRLCKLNFFDKFMQVMKLNKFESLVPKTYHAAKMLATDHQVAKESFFKALGETTCGKWIGKPYEHDMFGY